MARAAITTVAAVVLAPFVASAADLPVWRDAVVSAKSEAGFTFMASRHGFAEQQGLHVEMTQLPGDPIMLKALIADNIDSFEASPGATIIATGRGADLRILGCYWPVTTHGVFVRDDIKTVADLKGKTFAVSAPGGLSDLLARLFLEEHHVPTSEIKFVALGSDAKRANALMGGLVDAAVIAGEFAIVAQKNGIKLMEPAYKFAPDYPNICTVTTAAIIAKRPADVAHFVAAEIDAEHYAVTHRAQTIALTREVAHMTPDDPRPSFFYDLTLRYHAIDPDMTFPLKKLEWLQAQLIKLGKIAKPMDLTRLRDATVRKQALQFVHYKGKG